MAKARPQKKQEEKKQVYEFKNNPNFTPVATGDLKHSMKGRQFFYVKFEGKNYTHDRIQRFVQKIATKYADQKQAEYIQLTIDYSNDVFRSSKISRVDEPFNYSSAEYDGVEGNINGFMIYLA